MEPQVCSQEQGDTLSGSFFVLTDLPQIGKSKKRTRRVVKLDWEFQYDVAFWKWAIDQKLVSAEESLGAPFYAHVERTSSRRCYSDASFAAVGGFCPGLQVYWRYDLNSHLTDLLRNQMVTKGVDAITINQLELWHGDDSVRDTSHFARQAKNARRSSTVEGGQRCSSFVY